MPAEPFDEVDPLETRDLGRLVHRGADPVTAVVLDDCEPAPVHRVLARRPHVAQPGAVGSGSANGPNVTISLVRAVQPSATADSTRAWWGMLIGLLVWVLLLPAALLVRQPPDAAQRPDGTRTTIAPGEVAAALRSTPFIVLAATFFACCATHAGPIFHTISYAIACGVPTVAAVSIYSLEGLAGLGGRLVFGILGDRHGAKRVLIAGLLLQALGAGAFVFVNRLEEFYVVAAVFGFAYGGVMPLYAVLARDYFGQHIMGTVLGAAAMVSSLGMALGPSLGGWIFDTFGSYAWLYIGSFAMGVGAVAIALAFPAPAAQPALRPA